MGAAGAINLEFFHIRRTCSLGILKSRDCVFFFSFPFSVAIATIIFVNKRDEK